MKSVLISIRPKWCELIASGKKTIEVRKSTPKLDTPFKCYIYCTNDYSNYRTRSHRNKFWVGEPLNNISKGRYLCNGKVIGEFVCDKVITVDCDSVAPFNPETHDYIQDETCIDRSAFIHYTNFRKAFGWHISDLKIYDKPKELHDFYRPCERTKCENCSHLCIQNTPDSYETWCDCDEKIPLTRPPQSWCYVEKLE